MREALEIKIVFIFLIEVSSLGVGIGTLYYSKLKSNLSLGSIGNCFSGGIFFSVALIHLLPEGNKDIEQTISNEVPLGYILTILGYTIILIIEKILLDHSHGEKYMELKDSNKEMIRDKAARQTHRLNSPPEEDKSQFPSNDINEAILSNNSRQNTLETHKELAVTSFILAIALSVHSIFEGIAIGLQNNFSSTLKIAIAVMIHKLPAALALGINMKSISRPKSVLLMSTFATASPLGIGIGIGLDSMDLPLLTGIFLSLCSGTFLYITCSEILVEEFSVNKHKYMKLTSFLIGVTIFTALNQLLNS